ncbi:MAG: M24 family metallopeptidase, partial [Erysipelotrichaceae bacterium]|nr:M24 family metallopeptidase [Erysipelotrichaceae bacterium]
PIVAFGKNAADPHHMSDDTVLQEHQQVLIDMGSHYKGYCSDMTRTFLQKDDPKTEEIYDIVLKANLAAEAAVRPGVRFCDVDRAARKVIEDAGYGPYFTHRTGHGIGLEVHEPYDVSSSDEMIIQEGMCFSIEPGIYLPGETGVRIEDLVICGSDGAIVLNHFSKEKQYF